MKFLNKAAIIAALFGVIVSASGCGSKNDEQFNGPVGNQPVPQPQPYNPYQPYPGGPVAGAINISFTGQNIYSVGANVIGGEVIGSGQSTIPGKFCGSFILGFQCWTFANPSYINYGIGVLSIGGSNIPFGQAGTVFGYSKYEPQSGISMTFSQGSDPMHSNVSGTIILSSAFMQRNFPQGMPQIIGVAFDLNTSLNNATSNYGTATGGSVNYGGILIYTGRSATGYTGAFLRM